ncbi:hypothetical protein PMAYCL1PPCAC_22816 [Pristionchus mayeri]|uniref:histone acetyltransferase n=1 Tax=Pristionchus mayeri TaxID=1317129 RepID=A0AAN5I6V6_9BILA|nr:hypothetical protein PMAYCL1PPCAC_22814 [Pristionchus mayeri]GMR52621.1 hypothetical protein PMAYCL1PPCAC_22816 [Pristionchus mayeri]
MSVQTPLGYSGVGEYEVILASDAVFLLFPFHMANSTAMGDSGNEEEFENIDAPMRNAEDAQANDGQLRALREEIADLKSSMAREMADLKEQLAQGINELKEQMASMMTGSIVLPPTQQIRNIKVEMSGSIENGSSTSSSSSQKRRRVEAQGDSLPIHCSENAMRLLLEGYDPTTVSFPHLPSPSTPGVQSNWHEGFDKGKRRHMVGKMMHTIFPHPDASSIHDQRIKVLIEYCRKVEKDMFESAQSEEEYCHLVVDKINCMKRELEEKRAKSLQEHGY